MGDCLRAGETIAPASPSPAQSAVKGISYHATDFVYAKSSFSSVIYRNAFLTVGYLLCCFEHSLRLTAEVARLCIKSYSFLLVSLQLSMQLTMHSVNISVSE